MLKSRRRLAKRDERIEAVMIRRCLRVAIVLTTAVIAAPLACVAIFTVTSEMIAGALLLLTSSVLLLAFVGAVCESGLKRARLLGFALFGWGYFILAHWYSFYIYLGPLPTISLVFGSGALRRGALWALEPQVRLVHYVWSLVFAVAGGALCGFLFPVSPAGDTAQSVDSQSAGNVTRWWRKPVFIGLLGSGLVISAALAGWRSGSAIGGSTAFVLTCGVLAVAVTGALCGRGPRREAWLGSSAFGIGYLLLGFGPIVDHVAGLPTSRLLNAICRADYYEPIPFRDDPVMIVGHSLLAMLAAWFGGVAAPLVAGACRRRAGRARKVTHE
jgi:hypothetical protein